MSKFEPWFCPEHGPNRLQLWGTGVKETVYSDPWLSEVDENGALVFRYSDEEWEDAGLNTWTLACRDCDWKQERAAGTVYVQMDGY